MKTPVLVLTLYLGIFCLVQPEPGAAQTYPANAKTSSASAGYKLLAVKVSGTTRYNDKEILAASGLEIGQNAAEGDFKEAARRLGDSGLFSDVVYTFSYTDAGAKVEFKLTDTDKNKLVPAHFENFVWFTDAELLSAIQQRVPLFKQLLPVTGRLPDRVTQALQTILMEKHFPGRVNFLPEAKQEGAELVAYVYRDEEVSIRIRNVEFPGATPEQAAFLASTAHRLADADYLRSALAAFARLDLLPLFLERGYLKAVIAASDARVVSPPASSAEGAAPSPAEAPAPTEVVVDTLLPVTPGKQYMVSSVTWKGIAAVKTEEASPLFHLAEGKPANAVQLVRDSENLIRLYHSRGYMTAQVNPDPHMDGEKSTVHYDLNITEGDLYKMGELEILGLDTQSHDRVYEAWKLREGETYNADYTRKFLEDTRPLLPRGAQYSIKINEEINAKDKTVDVTIHFKMQ